VAIKQGITGPLGMDQTTFLMNDDQRPHSTPVHVKGEDGTWISIGEVLSQEPDWWSGGHGLYGPPSGSIYSNFLPFVTPEAVRMYNDFERALYAAL